MNSRLDLDALARELLQGLQHWLASEPSERPLRGVAEAVTAAREHAAESVAERYRERTGALLETLTERRAAFDGDDPTATELERRRRVIAKTRGLAAAAAARPVERNVEPLETQRATDALRQVRQTWSRRSGDDAALMPSGKPTVPQEKQPAGGRKESEGKESKGKKRAPSRSKKSDAKKSDAQKGRAKKEEARQSARPVREIPGVGATLASRLEEAGVTDAEAVAHLPLDYLSDVLEVSPKRAARIAEMARSLQQDRN